MFRSFPTLVTGVVVGISTASAAAQLGPPPVPSENPATPDKVALGKILFWDEQLSSDGTMACGTCHRPAFGGGDARISFAPGHDRLFGTDDDVAASPGVRRTDSAGWLLPHAAFGFEAQVTSRSSPSVFMASYAPELFWDGRASTTFTDPENGRTLIAAGGALESQSLVPILSSVEMASEGRTWFDVRRRLARVTPLALADRIPPDVQVSLGLHSTYPDLFRAAYGDPLITPPRIAFALASYQRTLAPDRTPWDVFSGGDSSALTPAQERGWSLFTGRANCRACHTPPHFTNDRFTNIGVRPPAEDLGRWAVTKNPADRGKFKNPTLRNAGLRARFFHDGSATSMREVLEFYNRGGDFHDNQDRRIFSLHLSDAELDDLEEFLTHALTDPRVAMESGPFARPRLASERPGPTTFGAGSAGDGGFVPQAILDAPSVRGTPLRIGVRAARGGATAFLIVDSAPASGPFQLDGVPIYLGGVQPLVHPILLDGNGPGAGFGTWVRRLPDHPGLVGTHGYAQWFIKDDQARGGYAASAGIRWTVE